MSTTRHILNHRSGDLELVLDEETGNFDLYFRSQPLPDPDFLRDVERWCKQIGTGWAGAPAPAPAIV
jgi:hypothetical protein